ncbi:MAG TPA: dehydrogenase [Planctomycetes bacterium]|nr:dehydrogenase [Planctomycetota bacterium]
MAKRKNWQLRRLMTYPYDAPPPKKQVAYIFDTNKCIECQTCTLACKTCWTSGKGQETVFWNNVETKPYGGYPTGWDLKLLEKRDPARWKEDGSLASETIFEDHGPLDPPTGHHPKERDYALPNLGEDDLSAPIEPGAYLAGTHASWMFYLARICNHCDHPACVAACPRKAIFKRDEDGIVLIDQERCRGYQECVAACPYKKTFFNMVTRTSEKCIGCFPRVEQGEVALCVESCIGKIRLHGFLTTQGAPRSDNPHDYLIKERKIALPLYPQFGTSPNVYYIPPLHVPDGILEQMFGPGVAEAKATYRKAKDDPDLLAALLLFGASNRIIERFERKGEEVVGWDGKGDEVARVPFDEPHVVRDPYDAKHDVYRHNTA